MRNNIIKFISNVRGVIHISIYRMKYVISQGKLGVCPYQNLLPFLPLLCLSLQSHSLQSSIAAQRLSLRVETISPLKDLVLGSGSKLLFVCNFKTKTKGCILFAILFASWDLGAMDIPDLFVFPITTVIYVHSDSIMCGSRALCLLLCFPFAFYSCLGFWEIWVFGNRNIFI